MEKNNGITKIERRATAVKRILAVAENIAIWVAFVGMIALGTLLVVLVFSSFWAVGLGYLPVIAVVIVALVLVFKALDRWSTREIEKAKNQRFMEQTKEGS